jgi:TolA-binding protein
MTTWLGRVGPAKLAAKRAAVSALAMVLTGSAVPAFGQDTLAETRLRKMEAEIRALQRQVFPGGDGKFFTPEITPGQPNAARTPPASTPVTDLLTRMEAIEGQLARLTAQVEQTTNRLNQLETRVGPEASETPANGAAAASAAADTNLAAMTGGASTPKTTPASADVAKVTPAAAPARTTAATPAPSAQRLAAVRAIEKPATSDPGDDEYSYGFRLWDAKFYPEAQQQLKMFIDRYPRHARISFARNLLGRAFLDDGKPRDAATWFLQNYQSDKRGARAADSLLYLAETMRQLKDTNRACIALAEFSETYAAEAAGRLKSQYEATRNAVKCTT